MEGFQHKKQYGNTNGISKTLTILNCWHFIWLIFNSILPLIFHTDHEKSMFYVEKPTGIYYHKTYALLIEYFFSLFAGRKPKGVKCQNMHQQMH